MNETVGKIEFGNNVPIQTPQICWMFDPEGALFIEQCENGFLLRTFTNGEDGYKIALPPRFVEVKDVGSGEENWIDVRYLLYEILEKLEIYSSKHHSTHLDIIVTDREGKRIDDGDYYED